MKIREQNSEQNLKSYANIFRNDLLWFLTSGIFVCFVLQLSSLVQSPQYGQRVLPDLLILAIFNSWVEVHTWDQVFKNFFLIKI